MSARVHGKSAQRASPGDRRVAFKGVLDNPFKVSWPYVPVNLQNTALACLVTMLAGVADYYNARHTASRKRKRARYDKARKENASAGKKRKVDHENTGVDGSDIEDAAAAAAPPDPPDAEPAQMDLDADTDELPTAPPIFLHLTVGINQVTKRLESQANSRRVRSSIRAPLIPEAADEAAPALEVEHPSLTHVFVCRADVDPPLLIAHLPELVAACNIPSPSQRHTPVQLIPLPKHAEYTLTEVVGLRRISVLAFDSTTPSLATLSSLFSSVQPPSAPWLTAPAPSRPLPHVPTHIKQLRTTAPHDIRTAKRTRTERRQAAKKRSKEKQAKRSTSEKGKEKPETEEKQKKRINISRIFCRRDPDMEAELESEICSG